MEHCIKLTKFNKVQQEPPILMVIILETTACPIEVTIAGTVAMVEDSRATIALIIIKDSVAMSMAMTRVLRPMVLAMLVPEEVMVSSGVTELLKAPLVDMYRDKEISVPHMEEMVVSVDSRP